MIYIFDIDGTLTPSRLPMDREFKQWFISNMKGKRIWFITGSDHKKTIQQVGVDLWMDVEKAYQCSGNRLYQNGELIESTDFDLPPGYEDDLNKIVEQSPYEFRSSNHIERRFGLVNFSVVGRDCSQELRDDYGYWDDETGELLKICEKLNKKYPDIEAVKGGQISIDIYKKGHNKGQILDNIDDNYMFFGDHLHPGGNDYSIMTRAEELGRTKGNHYIKVNSWKDTYNELKTIWK